MVNLNMVNTLIGMFHNFGPERKVVAEPGFEHRQTLYQSPNESHDNISSVRQCNH